MCNFPLIFGGPRTSSHEGGCAVESMRATDTPAFLAARDREAELTRTQATPAGAFRAARRTFMRGERLDMRSLAAALGISRATLYRWCGHRDRLLSDVLWSLSHQLFEQAKVDHGDKRGAERVLAVFRQHVGGIVRSRPLQVFLQQETHAALRLLTSEAGGVQLRTVRDLAELLREEQERGALELRGDADTLAYAIVRITEGFIYHDTVSGPSRTLRAPRRWWRCCWRSAGPATALPPGVRKCRRGPTTLLRWAELQAARSRMHETRGWARGPRIGAVGPRDPRSDRP